MSCDLLEPQRSRMTKSMSSSGVSSCYSEMDMDNQHDTDDEEDDAFISFTTTESKCEQLYQEGLELKYCGDYESSLNSFQRCLEGMQECQYFMKLPQTLQQLSELSHFLHDFQGAEEYQKAEKLFHEATEVQLSPAPSKEGAGIKHKKRKPFSKKPKPAMSMCNPAEYGNLLNRKAEELDKLSRACAKENQFHDALEHCSKAVIIRQCVFGRNHHSTLASMDSLRTLYKEASIYAATADVHCSTGTMEELKGDLSMGEQGAVRDENGSSISAECGGAQTLMLASVSNNDTPQCSQNNSAQLLLAKDSSTQTDTYFPLAGHCGLMAAITERRHLPSLYSITTPCRDVDTSDKEGRQECACDGIHKDSRQDKEALLNGVQGKSQDVVCAGDVKTKLLELKNPMCVVGGMKTNLGKLSELKNPMCVDLHKGPGAGTGNTRCLPLWILLLPALLALIGYYTFYYQ